MISLFYSPKSTRRMYTKNQPNTTIDAYHYFHLLFLFIPLELPLPFFFNNSWGSCCSCSLQMEVFWLRHLCAFSFLWRLTLKDWVQRGRHSTILLLSESRQVSCRKRCSNKKGIFAWCEHYPGKVPRSG